MPRTAKKSEIPVSVRFRSPNHPGLSYPSKAIALHPPRKEPWWVNVGDAETSSAELWIVLGGEPNFFLIALLHREKSTPRASSPVNNAALAVEAAEDFASR